MQRRADGWHLELVAFGGNAARADERVATVGGVKESRQIPLKRDGWERREFELGLDAKAGHEKLPVHIAIHAYGPCDKPDFVPDLSNADGVLFVESGDDAIDAKLFSNALIALSSRLGAPPGIVERVKGDSVKNQLRALVKRTVHALKAGELHAFWKETAQSVESSRDLEHFGPLTKETIATRPPGELVAFLLKVVQERGRRAVRSGRLPNSETYERCLSKEWRRLLVINALEMLVGDDGVAALFGAPGERAMDREDLTTALAGLKRIGATKKAEIIERALLVAREAKLWEGKPDELAAKVLEELTNRFYAVDDEPLTARFEEYILKAPDDFTLNAYED